MEICSQSLGVLFQLGGGAIFVEICSQSSGFFVPTWWGCYICGDLQPVFKGSCSHLVGVLYLWRFAASLQGFLFTLGGGALSVIICRQLYKALS